MAFESDFLDLMTSKVTVTPSSSRDVYGKTTFGTGVAGVPVHVEYSRSIVKQPGKEDVTSTARVWAPPSGTIVGVVTVPVFGMNDKVTLPNGQVRVVLSVDVPVDEDGVEHHQAVSLS